MGSSKHLMDKTFTWGFWRDDSLAESNQKCLQELADDINDQLSKPHKKTKDEIIKETIEELKKALRD